MADIRPSYELQRNQAIRTSDTERAAETKKLVLTPEETALLDDSVSAAMDLKLYHDQLESNHIVYNPVDAKIYVGQKHPLIMKTYPHVIEVLCHKGHFSSEIMGKYLLAMRDLKDRDKAYKDATYDMLYILDEHPHTPERVKKEWLRRIAAAYRSQDEERKMIAEEATEDVKKKEQEIKGELIKRIKDQTEAIIRAKAQKK